MKSVKAGIVVLLMIFVFFSVFIGLTVIFDLQESKNNTTGTVRTPSQYADYYKTDSLNEDETETVLLETEDYKITFIKLSDMYSFVNTLEMFLEVQNNSGNEIRVEAEDIYINDMSVSAINSMYDIAPNKGAIENIMILCDNLVESGIIKVIEDVKKIEFKLKVLDSATYKDILTTDTIILTF